MLWGLGKKMFLRLSFCVCVVVCAFAPFSFCSDRGWTLLEHMWLNRTVHEGVKISFEYENEHTPKMQCVLYQLGDMIRLDCNSKGMNQKVWYDGKYGWFIREGSDLVRTSRTYLAKQGEFCFDIRNLGLTSTLTLDVDFNELLERFRSGARIELDNRISETQKVSVLIGNTTIEYLIEEPSLRLLEVLAKTTGKTQQLDTLVCQYDTTASKEMTWLPSSVIFNSSTGRFTRISKVSYIGVADANKFTIEGADIPIGTAVVDFDQQFRLGYWTGSGIKEDFSGGTGIPTSRAYIWWIAIAGALFAIITLALFRLNRK